MGIDKISFDDNEQLYNSFGYGISRVEEVSRGYPYHRNIFFKPYMLRLFFIHE